MLLSLKQETSFTGTKAVTRKVSTTSAKSLPSKTMSQVVVVSRSQSESSPASAAVNGSELSPWHVNNVTENGVQRRITLTTEL